jgi:hypothetical protein
MSPNRKSPLEQLIGWYAEHYSELIEQIAAAAFKKRR